jgi:putative redox protein
MAVKIAAVYEGGLHCRAEHLPSGTELVTDAPTDNGGQGESFSPTDLVATALGNCVMTIIALVSERHGLDLRGMRVEVTKEMRSHPTRRIASLATIVAIPDVAVPHHEDRERLERAARHCPVHASLHPEIAAPITFRYESDEGDRSR